MATFLKSKNPAISKPSERRRIFFTKIHADLVFSGVYLVFEVFQDIWHSNKEILVHAGMLPYLVPLKPQNMQIGISLWSRSDLVLELTIPWTFWAGSFLSRFSGVRKRVVSKRVVLADVLRYQKSQRGYIRILPVPKTGTRAHADQKPEREYIRQDRPFTKALSSFTGMHLVLESFRQKWRTPVFALFA